MSLVKVVRVAGTDTPLIDSGGPAPVWGLTAYFLAGVLKDALAPAFKARFGADEATKAEQNR